jgi:hypothetical protein
VTCIPVLQEETAGPSRWSGFLADFIFRVGAASGGYGSFNAWRDREDGVGVSHFEDVEHFGGWSDQAEMAAPSLYVAVEQQEHTQARAVEEFNAGEIEDEFVDAVIGKLTDLCFDFAQTWAEVHASGESKDGGSEIDRFVYRFERHERDSYDRMVLLCLMRE